MSLKPRNSPSIRSRGGKTRRRVTKRGKRTIQRGQSPPRQPRVRRQKSRKHPARALRSRPTLAQVVLTATLLYYLIASAILLPDKFRAYGVLVGAIMTTVPLICAFDHFHHLCRGIAGALWWGGIKLIELANGISRLPLTVGRGLKVGRRALVTTYYACNEVFGRLARKR